MEEVGRGFKAPMNPVRRRGQLAPLLVHPVGAVGGNCHTKPKLLWQSLFSAKEEEEAGSVSTLQAG